MASNIPTRFDSLRADVNPFPPPHKRLKYIDTNYPTGVNGLTTDILQHRNVTTHDGGQSNETVDITRYSRGQAAEGLTAGQLVFRDNDRTEIESYMSIHEVNRILAGFDEAALEQKARLDAQRGNTLLKTYARRQNVLKYICDRFKFVGILSSNDTPVGRLKGTKAINISVFGETRVFDYWSYGIDRKVRAYDTCYIALRMVESKRVELFRNEPHGEPGDSGFRPDYRDGVPLAERTPIWQFVPVFNSDEALDDTDIFKPVLGAPWTYWRLGKMHEFPTLPGSNYSKSRDFRSTSRNAMNVLDGSQRTTIQFKMNCKKM